MNKSYSITVKHNGEYWHIGIHEEPVTLNSRHFGLEGVNLKDVLSSAADVIDGVNTETVFVPAQ